MKCFLSIIFSYVFSIGFSQDYFDIAKFTYTNTPPNNFSTSNGQTTVEEIGLELNFPIPINNKTILLTGLFSNRTRVKLDAKMSHTNLYVVGLNIGVNTIFNEQWSATLGGRWTKDKKTFSENCVATIVTPIPPADAPDGTPAPFPTCLNSSFQIADWSNALDKSFQEFTPRAVVQYQLNDATSFYGSYSKGFQAGGFQTLCFGIETCATSARVE